MKNSKKIILGVILLLAGVIFALNSLEITNIDFLFPGWWTLFIIIPCLVGVVTDKDKTGSIIGLAFGVLLLLSQLEVLDISYVWKLGVPLAVIIIALKLIIGGFIKKDSDHVINVHISSDIPDEVCVFGGKKLSYDGQVFNGGEFVAVFGGLDCDLSGAIIEKDCHIEATAVFGGATIILPKNVNVKLDSTAIFGGVDNKYIGDPTSSVTVTIEATGFFGGVDIK